MKLSGQTVLGSLQMNVSQVKGFKHINLMLYNKSKYDPTHVTATLISKTVQIVQEEEYDIRWNCDCINVEMVNRVL